MGTGSDRRVGAGQDSLFARDFDRLQAVWVSQELDAHCQLTMGADKGSSGFS